eukprot:5285610-Lingulodinium_polyedra.AAC.1
MLMLTSTIAQLGAAFEYNCQSDAGVTDTQTHESDEYSERDAMLVRWPVPSDSEQNGQIEPIFH